MEFKAAKTAILKKYEGSQILQALDTPSAYVFALKPKGIDRSLVNDNFYSVDKKSGKIAEWSIFLHPEEYTEAVKHPINLDESEEEIKHQLIEDALDIYHSGRLGMKWGVKNGPPYPLDENSMSGEERKHVEFIKLPNRTGMLKDLRIDVNEFTSRYLDPATRHFFESRKNDKIDPATGLPLTPKKMTISDDLARVNPSNKQILNKGSKNNCGLCSMTYDMRRRGFDVTARMDTYGLDNNDIKTYYPGVRIKTEVLKDSNGKDKTFSKSNGMSLREATTLFKNLNNSILSAGGNGSRGIVGVDWIHGGGHWVAYEVQNGKVKYIDAQINKIHTNRSFINELSYTDGKIDYGRLDHLRFNKHRIKEIVR